ncbi:hypothetical protein ZWY2020_051106 [Hordeum vulgare]|nr:hypothetical protein ZWY2020_051106 [Hordeum vulgare]
MDVNVERAEDVLTHKRLLELARDPAQRPAFAVRAVQVSRSSPRLSYDYPRRLIANFFSPRRWEGVNPYLERMVLGDAGPRRPKVCVREAFKDVQLISIDHCLFKEELLVLRQT